MKSIIAELTKKFVGKPAELGKVDSFRMIYEYLKMKGIKISKEFEELSRSIKKLYEANPHEAVKAMVYSLDRMFKKIELHEMKHGDIVFLRYNFSPIFPGIVLVNGNCLICSKEKGVIPIPLRYYQIERVLRCGE